MREIIDNTSAPTHKVSKWLVEEFSKLERPPSKSVLNTLDFVNKVKDVTIDLDEVLVSFDVAALFPSVPIKETLNCLESWLTSQSIDEEKVSLYMELSTLCMEQNIFCFDGVFYKQTKGTAMGNSLSPFLANLLMGHLEQKIEHNPAFPRIWYRYVDDIFAVLNRDKLQETLTLLNNQFDSINFTYEKEVDGCLPFLDLKVIRKHDKLEFDIYRKPTFSPRFITWDSYHSFQHKYAAFNSMIHRLLTVPLSEDKFSTERLFILDLARFNGLDQRIIVNTIEKLRTRLYRDHETTLICREDTKRKHIKLTYFPTVSNKLAGRLKKLDVSVAFSSGAYKMRNLLPGLKDRIDDMKKSGVYKLKCTGCDFVYIGMTSRSLSQRYKEHEFDIKSGNEKTAIAKHVKQENNALGRGRRMQRKHGIGIERMELLKPVMSHRNLAVWESIYICNRSSALNDNDGLVDSQLIGALSCLD